MGDQYDAPNQQVVRPDGSGPWDEGTGGGEPAPGPTQQKKKDTEEQPEEKSSVKRRGGKD